MMRRTLLVVSLLPICVLSATTSSDPSTGSPEITEPTMTTCGGTICVNGDARGSCVDVCNCNVKNLTYFDGDSCDVIILNGTVTVTTSARTGNLTWNHPPQIDESRYRFVYVALRIDEDGTALENDIKFDEIMQQEFNMIDDTTARIINLDSGGVIYNVSVINSEQADYIVENQNSSSIENYQWTQITTQNNLLWGYDIAAYIISAFIIVTVIALIVIKLVTDRIDEAEKEKYHQLHKSTSKTNDVKKAKSQAVKTSENEKSQNVVNDNSNQSAKACQNNQSERSKQSAKSTASYNLGYEASEIETFTQPQQNTASYDFDEPDADY